MISRTVWTSAFGALLLATGAGAGWDEDAGDPGRGRSLAERRCAGCHAVGRTGASPLATAPPFRDLHARYDVENLAEALVEGVITKHPEMPSAPLPAEDVRDLIAYLRSLEGPPKL